MRTPRPAPPSKFGTERWLDNGSLWEEHRSRLFVVARRLLRDEEDARDAVQEAFLCAYRSRASFRGESSWGTWLYRILVNACLMTLRRRRRRPEIALEEIIGARGEEFLFLRAAAPLAGRGTPADVLVARRQIRARIEEGLLELPAHYRAVILLRDFEGYDTGQAARLLGVTANTVKVRLHRARAALRHVLSNQGQS